MTEHFYDGQIRKYLVQVMRLFSNFSYKTGKGEIIEVPVSYGDMTRQVGNILRDNSENKLPSAPRMAVYITGLELDRDRTSDASYVNKRHVRERAYDEDGKEYLNFQGKNYTIERLMPTPYRLLLNVDLWSTNTNQKLQILEQILQLFNPSLEIQTTDNYLDWTSLSVVNLETVNFTNRTIPAGIESEIDVAQLNFSTPIYISPPAKVKRLGVVTNIVTSIFEGTGYVDFEAQLENTDLFPVSGTTDARKDSNIADNPNSTDDRTVDRGAFANQGNGELEVVTQVTRSRGTIVGNPNQRRILLRDGKARILNNGYVSDENWNQLLNELPGDYHAGLSIIYLRKPDIDDFLAGRITVNPLDETELIIEFDRDTLPSNDIVQGPARDPNQNSSVDYIIDPLRFDPTQEKDIGVRMLLLGSIGDNSNSNGASAWKNNNGTDFVAGANDIIEWDGSAWHIVFDASQGLLPYTSETVDSLYITNLNTSVQYYWDSEEWLLSVDGEYAKNDWTIDLDG
jgi:hypothetical protein